MLATMISDERHRQILDETAAWHERNELWKSMRFVRGMSFEEASKAVDQLKREGRLEEALDLAYACSDAMERANAVIGITGAGSWYERQAIILRKMGDYEAEVRLIEDVHRRFPDKKLIIDRLPRARALLEKQSAGDPPSQ